MEFITSAVFNGDVICYSYCGFPNATSWDVNGSLDTEGGAPIGLASSTDFYVEGSFTPDNLDYGSVGTLTLDGSLDADTHVDIFKGSANVSRIVINRTINSATTRTLSIVSTSVPFGNSPSITLNNSGAGSYHLSIDNGGGTTTFGTGTLVANIEGTFTNYGPITRKTATRTNTYGGAFNAEGAVTFIGDGDGAADTYSLSFASSYTDIDVALTDSNDTLSASGTLTLGGNFTLNSGTFSAPTTLSVAGDFSRNGGTFQPNSGTVSLVGAGKTIAGSTSFYNLTKSVSSADALYFTAGTTQTTTGTLTLQGASGQPLSLRSSAGGST
jgi:hypothetical protein